MGLDCWLVCLSILVCHVASQAYFTLSEDEIGRRDYLVANGNPMKGLIANPEFYYDPSIDNIDSSMDIYYVPVGNIMLEDPNVVGYDRAFDWSYLEERLANTGARNRHAVLSFAVHYPGKPLSLPGYLNRTNLVPLHWYDEFLGGGLTPDYGSPPLLNALTEFVQALGRKYDGDNRIAFIHLGLLGYWGEWHTFPLSGLVPDYSKDRIAAAFRQSFNVTKLQARYPDSRFDEFGYYDGSFAYETLDGDANGGVINKEWYFWPVVEQKGQNTFWKTAPMGGETRPEIQHIIFEELYPRRTYQHQDFEESVRITHASYMLHSNAFVDGGYNGTEFDNALRGHTLLGYNFIVTKVSAIKTNATSGVIDVAVTIEQIGVAPFYYPLALVFGCPDLRRDRRIGRLETLVDYGSFTTLTFKNVPATAKCLDSISLALDSPMLLPGRKMKFSQGNGVLTVSLPLPDIVLEVKQPGNDQNSTEVVVSTQPSVESTHEFMPTTDQDNVTTIEFYYLVSKSNGVNKWAALRNGNIIEAPEFGLFLEARPSKRVSSIWFTFGTNMKIEYVSPYTLDNNSYLVSAGAKNIIATAYEDSRSVGMASLSFGVTVPRGAVSLRRFSKILSQVSVGDGDDSKKLFHVAKSVNYTAHGFNTPYAPSLLQLVSLDPVDESIISEEARESDGILSFLERLYAKLP